MHLNLRFFLLQVCQIVWISTLEISSSYFYKIRKKFLTGSISLSPDTQRSPLQKTSEAIAWMNNYFDLIGDYLPHHMAIHLPSGLTKVLVYQKMVTDFKERNKSNIIGQSNFFKIWERHFPNVKIPKENRFTKCDTCSIIKLEKEKTNNKEKLMELNHLLDDHIKLQMEQRKRYHSIREQAETDMTIMSVIIDGMDQNSTNLPHMKRIQKSDVNLWFLRTHLTGAIVHGHAVYAFLDFMQWPHDPNLTTNLIAQLILLHFTNLNSSGASLPRKLYIQLDNTARENKNRCVLSFLSFLVHVGIFDEVQLGFLMVGHTHEDIDALFGNISKWLKRNNALTVPEFISGCKQANRLVQDVIVLHNLFDVKSWLLPNTEELHNHSHPHIFRFTRCENAVDVQMHYKMWAKDPWEPGLQGIVLLKNLPDMECPNVLKPRSDKLDMQALHRSVFKYSCLNDDHKSWWTTFLEHLENSINVQNYQPDASSWYLTHVRYQEETNVSAVLTDENCQHVQKRLRKDTPPPVYTGRRSHKTNREAHVSHNPPSQTVPPNQAQSPVTQAQPSNLPHSPSTQQIIADIETNCYVVVEHPEWDDEPIIGRVLSYNQTNIEVRWYDGKYKRRWKPSRERKEGQYVPWIDNIHPDYVLLKFTITAASDNSPEFKLEQHLIDQIKLLYKH
jgi:hypothetical protein